MRKGLTLLLMLAAASLLGGCDFLGMPICTTAPAPSIRLPAAPGRPGAGYFYVHVTAAQGDLVAVSSPQIGIIEMHETRSSSGVASMRPIERMSKDACDRISTSDGRHLMLFDVDPALRPGDYVQLTFHFERGEPRSLAARVEAPGEARH